VGKSPKKVGKNHKYGSKIYPKNLKAQIKPGKTHFAKIKPGVNFAFAPSHVIQFSLEKNTGIPNIKENMKKVTPHPAKILSTPNATNISEYILFFNNFCFHINTSFFQNFLKPPIAIYTRNIPYHQIPATRHIQY
jgi:hypothetical protein